MDEIEIYECRLEDVDNFVGELKELWLCLAHEMYEIEHFIKPSETNSDRWIKFVQKGLASERSLLLVAKNKNRLVGFVFANASRDFPLDVSKFVGAVNDVYVLPQFRCKGIGKKLMVKCLNRMKALGMNVASLTVLMENKTAIKLYEKLGFKIHGYTMVKTL